MHCLAVPLVGGGWLSVSYILQPRVNTGTTNRPFILIEQSHAHVRTQLTYKRDASVVAAEIVGVLTAPETACFCTNSPLASEDSSSANGTTDRLPDILDVEAASNAGEQRLYPPAGDPTWTIGSEG